MNFGNKKVWLFILAACIMLLSGCKSHEKSAKSNTRYVEAHKSDSKKSNKHLSDKLGIEISDGDDVELYAESAKWLGVPYKYGGNTAKGIDCSGLVVKIYDSVYNKKLYRSSADILDKNCKRISKSKLRAGDLVFFATGKNKKRVNHVGIYFKEGKFIHSSTSKGVIVSSLHDNYYVRTYISAGRVL